MSESEFAIEATGLGKTYAATKKTPSKHALKSIDLAVPRGGMWGVLGPNGAGKSTFINILAGLVTKSEGEARICGYDIDGQRRMASAFLGVVPQEIAMDPFFTPRESLELMAGFFGVPKKDRRTDHLLESMGLTEQADSYGRQLSGGMKRRLMVAKALVHAPPVLILDEPTAGVDVELRRHLWSYIRQLHKNGVTVILTTHYLEEAQELCDTIAIIHHGEVIACQPTPKLLQRLDYKTLLICPSETLTSVPEALRDLKAELRADGILALTYRTGKMKMDEILDRIRDCGISIADLTTKEPDLEDVFVFLTSKDNRRKSQ